MPLLFLSDLHYSESLWKKEEEEEEGGKGETKLYNLNLNKLKNKNQTTLQHIHSFIHLFF